MPSLPPTELFKEEPAPKPASISNSPFGPMKRPAFRMLWTVWMTANLCMWMNDVAAAWMMTSLTTTPIWVALVQTASTLPVFLLGLPSGALADILDRRRYFIVTQFWVAGVAALLCAAILSGVISPGVLLALTFLNGIGLAMRWPVFAAIVPELVPRAQLPAALALNGIAMNASRIVGPLVAGAIIASAGSAYVFILNATLSLISALLAMLPLVARGLHGGDAGTFTLLLAAMGSGAITAAMFLPRLRQAMSRDGLVMRGAALQSAATAVVAFSPNAYVAVPAMFVAGMAWISTANSLSVSAQLGLPDWVRARGMSIYQMAIMGASALGAALWGQVATMTSVRISLSIAATTGVLAMLGAHRLVIDRSIEEDLTPSRELKAPVTDAPPKTGHVHVTIEYLIDPARAEDFRILMQESRRSRLRQGALSWELLRDLGDPGRFIELVIDESWTEHLRRFDRVTAWDVTLRERKLAFHIGDEPPVITRFVADATPGE
jgi:MFS family permease